MTLRAVSSSLGVVGLLLLAACSGSSEGPAGEAEGALAPGNPHAGKHRFDNALPHTNGRACATCHVEVCASWAPKLHPARDEEEAMLDEVPILSPTSRLSCQIIYTPELDGLSVKLVPQD